MDTLLELIKKNRSYRGYDESYHFTREQLEAYVDATRYTASSANMQPLKYYIAWEPEMTAKIQPTTLWAGALPQLHLPYEGQRPTAFIVICLDTDVTTDLPRFQKDVGIAAQTILLLAADEGLGGCMIGSFKEKELREIIGLADHLQPQLVVALGKPAEKIVLTTVAEHGDFHYYRDADDVHYVPKRALEDILI